MTSHCKNVDRTFLSVNISSCFR